MHVRHVLFYFSPSATQTHESYHDYLRVPVTSGSACGALQELPVNCEGQTLHLKDAALELKCSRFDCVTYLLLIHPT